MWQNFTVRNFRPFSGLVLQPLGRVNLIAGKNNTGKTALLEAIHLHSYPQDVVLPYTINELRGAAPLKRFDQDVCSWLFYDKNASHGLVLISQDDKGETRSLQMQILDAAARAQLPDAKQLIGSALFQKQAWDVAPPALILRTEAQGKKHLAAGFLSALGDRLTPSSSRQAAWDELSVFIGSAGRQPDEDVKAFSELEIANRQEELLPSLQILEPRLQRLAIVLSGGKPVIHGSVRGLSRLVPMTFMGEGIRRLLSILLAITTAAGGKVLIDEVENGLHYSVLTKVWQAIAHAARQANAQVFATTHSYECIVAAHEAFTAHGPYDLRLFRLDRIGEEIKVAAYDKDVLGYATEMNHEVR
jgi:hypothetical protein